MALDTLYAIQFNSVLYQLAQQKESKFASKVRRETVANAELAFWDTVGADDDPVQQTTRHPTTPLTEGVYGRRKILPTKWHKGRVLDSYDQQRMLANLNNSTTQSFAMSFGRKKDKLIIAAAVGTAYTGKDGTGTAAFKDESLGINGDGTITTLGTLAVNGVEVPMTLAKMLLMMEIFNESDVDENITKYWAVTPNDVKHMLNMTEYASADFADVKAIQVGKLVPYNGFNFFWSNLLDRDTVDGTSTRTLAWAEDGIILGYIGDLTTEITTRTDLCNEPQIYSKMDLGAVRMEGAKVHECLNLVTQTLTASAAR
jgi:hypothetical protein